MGCLFCWHHEFFGDVAQEEEERDAMEMSYYDMQNVMIRIFYAIYINQFLIFLC